MRVARVWQGKDGYTLTVESVPHWAVVVDWVAGNACALTRHVFCTPRDWTWEIGWGRDEDGVLRHSLGGWLWLLTSDLLAVEIKHSREEFEVPLTDEQVAEHFPDCLMEFNSEDSSRG